MDEDSLAEHLSDMVPDLQIVTGYLPQRILRSRLGDQMPYHVRDDLSSEPSRAKRNGPKSSYHSRCCQPQPAWHWDQSELDAAAAPLPGRWPQSVVTKDSLILAGADACQMWWRLKTPLI